MIFLKVVFFYLILYAIGFIFIFLFARRKDEVFLWSCFPIGAGVITLQMYIYSILDIEFNLVSLLGVWAVLSPLSIYRFLKTSSEKRYLSTVDIKKIVIFAILLLSILFINIVKSLSCTLMYWDSWSHWGFMGKVFFMNNKIPWMYFIQERELFPHRDYPLFLPLYETLAYKFIGNFDDRLVKIFLSLLFINFVFHFVAMALSDKHAPFFVMGIVLFILTLPEYFIYLSNGYADFPFSYFSLVSIFFLNSFLKNKTRDSLILSSYFLGLCMWTKKEGLVWLVVILVLFYLCRKKIDGIYLFYILSSFVWITPLLLVHWVLGVGSSYEINIYYFLKFFLPFLRDFFIHLGKLFIDFKNWHLFWIMVLLSGLFIKLYKKEECLYSKSLIWYLSLIFLILFILGPSEKLGYRFYLVNTLRRFFLHMTGVGAFIILESIK